MASSAAADELLAANQRDAIDKKPPMEGRDAGMDKGELERRVGAMRAQQRLHEASYGNGAASALIGYKR